MKLIHKDKQTYTLRFDADDEVIEGLKGFCGEYGIHSGSFTALGSARETVLAYYNLDTKEYEDTMIDERVEVASVVGNISKRGDELVVHAHGVISDQSLKTKAGHIQKLVVSATVELTLFACADKIERRFDEDTGLSLME